MEHVLFIGIPVLFFAAYVGLVLGTSQKLQHNGIHLVGNARFLFPLVPLALFAFHLFWAIKTFRHSPKKSLKIMSVVIFNYPIVVGVIIELMLEDIAFSISGDPEISKVNKKRAIKKHVDKKKLTDIDSVPNSIWNDYRSTLKEVALQTP